MFQAHQSYGEVEHTLESMLIFELLGGLCNLVRRGRHKLAHILMISDRRKEIER